MSNQKEVWRPVPFPHWVNRYEISNHGRVRSLQTKRLRVIYVEKTGYARVHLFSGNSRKNNFYVQRFSVHRLVAFAFIGHPPSPTHQIHHKDHNKINNCPHNLEWVTHLENQRYSPRKLTVDSVRSFKKRIAAGELPTKIAKEFGICFGMACQIVRGERWKDI